MKMLKKSQSNKIKESQIPNNQNKKRKKRKSKNQKMMVMQMLLSR